MAKRYVVQKVGDNFVPVLQEPYPKLSKGTWLVWGAALIGLGLSRRGLLGNALLVSGVVTGYGGFKGTNPWCGLSDCIPRRAKREEPSLSPSYQNDYTNRAGQRPADYVDEASMESFPASDPPTRTGVELPH